MIDKRITARKNFQGGGKDASSDDFGGGGTKGGNGGNKGDKSSQGPSARDRAMGLQGKTGVTDKSLSSGGDGVDRTRTKTIDRLNRIKDIEDLIDRPKFGFTDAAKYNLFSPQNIFSGLLSLVNPALGFITRNIKNIPQAIQDLRGYNPDGTPRTQEQYEQARRDRQIQGRIDNIMDRQRLGKTFSQTNLDSLMGMTDMYGDKFSPSTAQNVLTGRDLKGFTDSRMGITSPEIIARATVPNKFGNFPNLNVAPAPDRFSLIDRFSNTVAPNRLNNTLQEQLNLIDRFSNTVAPNRFDNTGIETLDVDLPGNDLMAFAPNSKLDRALKNLYSGYENLGIKSPQMIELMKQDLLENKEKGTPLSLPSDAYTLVG